MAAHTVETPPTPASDRPLILLDGMSLAFRAYFALPTTLTTSSGVVTNAVHGFASMVVNLVRDHHPSGLAVAFDLPGGTFRDALVEEYKGGRAETPPDLPPQFELIRTMLESLAIPVVSAEGYEADDVLATLATEARDRRQPVIVVTGDRDAYQLVEDPYVRVLYNKRGVSEYALYDEAGIEERTGVRPPQYPILAALRGDPSDNLPGVPGVGEKTAAKLVNEYGDIEALYAHLDTLSPKLRENLAASLDRVRQNLTVIPLVRDVPLDVHVDDLTLGGWDLAVAERTFAELEMRNMWTRVSGLLRAGAFGVGSDGGGAGPEDEAVVDHEDPRWLAELMPKVVPAATAVEAIDTVVADARSAGVAVGLAVSWEGQPGRSPLTGLALSAGPTGEEAADVVVVVAEAGQPLLSAPGLRAALQAALGVSGVPSVVHDAKELMRSLLADEIDLGGLRLDTAVAAYLLDPSVDRYRVEDLARRYLEVELTGAPPTLGQGAFELGGTDEEDAAAAPTATVAPQHLALARSAAAVVRLEGPINDALVEVKEDELYRTIEHPLIGVLAKMEVVGIAVDVAILRAIAAELADRCRIYEAELHELAGGPFNVNSVPQLRTVLYERLGLPQLRKTKTGPSTDARTLEQLREYHPIIEVLLHYREVEKLRSTYGESLAAEVAPDGRIHATFRQTVARTGRLSSDQPNLHNIPVRTEEGRRFRQAFVPSPHRRLLVADYDQVELRAIAHLSGDPGLTSAFAAGEDIHRTVAARVFGIERDEVTHEQRSVAKMVSYGLAYGMEAYGLAQRLAVPVEEAQAILQAFFQAFPSVRAYMDEAVEQARRAGYTVTSFGRRRPLPDLLSSNYQVRQAAERQAMNAGIQGLAADLFKLALLRLDDGLRTQGLHSDLVLQVHDEVILDVVADEEEAVASLCEEAMVGAAELHVPLKVAMAWGSSWAEAKDG